MAKAGGGKRGRKKAEDALSRKATQHHDFVGQATAERARSRAVEEARIERGHRELEKEVVQEMASELEQMAGVAEPTAGSARPVQREQTASSTAASRAREPQGAVRGTIDLFRRGAPEALDALRAKAEERLKEMPWPVKSAIHLTERAFGLALWPVRAGVHLMGRVLETPAALLRILLTRRTA
jgi:hypothetical protein